MFRFVFAWHPGESYDALAADGFVGVESASESPSGVPLVGVRATSVPTDQPSDGGQAVVPPLVGVIDGGYAVFPPDPKSPPHAFGQALHRLWAGQSRVRLLIENGLPYATAHDLWTLMEAVRLPAVGVALDVDVARRAGQASSVLVPTLNLRIGLLRVRQPHDDLAGYARRLAGIGYEGYVVLDPPDGPDRPAAALALAATFRSVFPAKPVKKAPPAKAATANT